MVFYRMSILTLTNIIVLVVFAGYLWNMNRTAVILFFPVWCGSNFILASIYFIIKHQLRAYYDRKEEREEAEEERKRAEEREARRKAQTEEKPQSDYSAHPDSPEDPDSPTSSARSGETDRLGGDEDRLIIAAERPSEAMPEDPSTTLDDKSDER